MNRLTPVLLMTALFPLSAAADVIIFDDAPRNGFTIRSNVGTERAAADGFPTAGGSATSIQDGANDEVRLEASATDAVTITPDTRFATVDIFFQDTTATPMPGTLRRFRIEFTDGTNVSVTSAGPNVFVDGMATTTGNVVLPANDWVTVQFDLIGAGATGKLANNFRFQSSAGTFFADNLAFRSNLVVPEPASLVLMGTGMLLLLPRKRRL